jgi:hypothetical protein
VDYGASSGGTGSFYSLSHAEVTGSATGVEIANLSGWKIDTAGNKLTLTWNKADEFMNSGAVELTAQGLSICKRVELNEHRPNRCSF